MDELKTEIREIRIDDYEEIHTLWNSTPAWA